MTPKADVPTSTPFTRGATLSCPPFCLGSSIVPLPVASSTGTVSFVPALLVSGSSGQALNPLPTTGTTFGVYYTPGCSGPYTDPQTGACTNASNPASAYCAYGSDSTCQLCPVGM